MKLNILILIFLTYQTLLFGQASVVYNKESYDSLIVIKTKNSFNKLDKKSQIGVSWIETIKHGDSTILNKTTCNLSFLDCIKRKNKKVYCIYRKTVSFSAELFIRKKKQKSINCIEVDHVSLVDSAGEEVAYVFGYGEDLYVGTKNDSLLLFQNRKISDKILSIDPLSQDLEVQAKDDKNSIYIWVRLLFYEDKAKTKVTLFPKR